ncbi:hypothetical protein [Streptomyces paludis]|uniref:Uncharacterized protein n=1 Tax=Streptomyces paludis TaxID=2282738 RepID=A0A345HWT5_9ACTN|nr:hypothetical protein [Streptomyces paludis]AXG81159.1 hypothetical protein DVK44_29605 [Streptomyces paludis]
MSTSIISSAVIDLVKPETLGYIVYPPGGQRLHSVYVCAEPLNPGSYWTRTTTSVRRRTEVRGSVAMPTVQEAVDLVRRSMVERGLHGNLGRIVAVRRP